MFFCQNNIVSRIPVLTTFDAWGNLFFSLFLANFSTLNDFTINFFAKEVALITFPTYYIYHFLYLPPSMLEEISSSWYFGKKFIVKWIHNWFFAKGMILVLSPERTLSRSSFDFAFSFWLYSSEQKRRIPGNFFFFN